MKKKTQEEFYDFIWNMDNWRPPAFSKMKKFLGIKSNQSVLNRLDNFREKGKKLPNWKFI